MTSLRFATVRDLYEAFPWALEDVGEPASDASSLDFLRGAVAEAKWGMAISYCAYLLPRRETVWWGCQSLRRMAQLLPQEAEILAVAEAWVREPEEERRRAALELSQQADTRLPATWMALAAGWSGGSIVPPQMGIVPAPPYQTARAVRAGLMIGMTRIPNADLAKVMQACVEDGIHLAIGTADAR